MVDAVCRLLRVFVCVCENLNHNLSNEFHYFFSVRFLSIHCTWNMNWILSLSMIKWGDASTSTKRETKTSKEKLMDEKLSWSNAAKRKRRREKSESCEEKLLCFLFIERINGFVAPHTLETTLEIQLQPIRFIFFVFYINIIAIWSKRCWEPTPSPSSKYT